MVTHTVELHGTLELGDFIRFQYFHALRRIWLIVAIVVVFFAAFIAIVNRDELGAIFVEALPLVLLWLFFGACPYWRTKKLWASQPYFREPITYVLTDETISGTSLSAQWKIAWPVIRGAYETRSLFLLYNTSASVVIVPKRFFQQSSEIDRWREFVAPRLGSKRIEKPSFVARFL